MLKCLREQARGLSGNLHRWEEHERATRPMQDDYGKCSIESQCEIVDIHGISMGTLMQMQQQN